MSPYRRPARPSHDTEPHESLGPALILLFFVVALLALGPARRAARATQPAALSPMTWSP